MTATETKVAESTSKQDGIVTEALLFFGIRTEEDKQAILLAIFSSIMIIPAAFFGYVAGSLIAPESPQFAIYTGVAATCFVASTIGVITVLTKQAVKQIVEIKLKKEE